MLMRAGRRREAIAAYERLLGGQPDLADCWYNLGYLLKAEGRFDDALQAYERALACGISGPEEVHLNRSVIYADHLRKDGLAIAELNAALAHNPAYLPALLNLGNIREEQGEAGLATDSYERILSSTADAGTGGRKEEFRGEALARLAHLRPPQSLEDPFLRLLSDTASKGGHFDAVTRANLYYSLGRAYDALGAFDKAFTAFQDANAFASRLGAGYSRMLTKREIDAQIAAFSSAAVAEPGPAPIFICGMFRSGSTLVEQALSAHPNVTAGGELNILRRLTTALAPFPASISLLSDTRAAELARAYSDEVAQLFLGAAGEGHFVTDKRPDNFVLIGLIKRLFPAARIVHTVRHPLDTCLSGFFQHIDQNAAGYSTDLGDAGHYFGEYRRLMAHWKSLYPESIFDFDYDAFVASPRPALKALLEFLGLNWNDDCLDFHRRKNTVKTASYWQVRKPLYADSSGRWRNYDAHLRPLRDALKAAGVSY